MTTKKTSKRNGSKNTDSSAANKAIDASVPRSQTYQSLIRSDGPDSTQLLRKYDNRDGVNLIISVPLSEEDLRKIHGVSLIKKVTMDDAASIILKIGGNFDIKTAKETIETTIKTFDVEIYSNYVIAGLSRRQREVFIAVAEDLANKEIADKLKITVRTVKFHISALLTKFGVTDRAGLRKKARMVGPTNEQKSDATAIGAERAKESEPRIQKDIIEIRAPVKPAKLRA